LIQGWLTTFAWIFVVAATQATLSNISTALISFNHPDYVIQRWHTTLFICLFIILPLIPNFFFRRIIAVFETTSGIACIVFFIIHMITLLVLGRGSDDAFVWKNLIHSAPYWTNPGIAWCIGLLSPVTALLGMDGVLHMSDEVKNVETRVPWSIISAVISNSVLQFAFVLTVLYRIGKIETVLGDTTGLPIIQVYYQATGSKAWTNVLIATLAIMMFFCLSNTLVSVSRLTWAFARDRGLPFSNFFAYIHPKLQVPINTLILICFVSLCLALINIGSSVAYNAILSLCTLGIFISYFFPILFILLKKVTGRNIEKGPFNLGRWGIPVNLYALLFITFIIIWMPWPSMQPPVTKLTMNYAGPVLIAIILLALGDWFTTGKRRFVVPEAQRTPFFFGKDKQA